MQQQQQDQRERLCARVWRYCRRQYWELPANILEGITLVLLVFVQDVAFKESLIVCAGLLFISLALHGLAYKAGQCKVWPKVIELAAPVPFVAMLPPAYLATVLTQKTAFITINMWFAVVEVVLLLLGRNFMMDYLQDWNPKEVWGTPLLQRCASYTAAVWIGAQLLMAVAQGLAVAFNLSVDNGSNVGAAVFVCYLMQLLPLLVAIVFTFACPAWLKKRWGYVRRVRGTCYPPPASGSIRLAPDASLSGGGTTATSSSSSQQSMGSAASEDVMVCISPRLDSKAGGKGSSGSGTSSSTDAEAALGQDAARGAGPGTQR